MEQIQPLQPEPTESTMDDKYDLLPAEVGREIHNQSVPWRDDPGEAMAANVYTTSELGYTYGSQIFGGT